MRVQVYLVLYLAALEQKNDREAQLRVIAHVLAPVVIPEHPHHRRLAVPRKLAVEHNAHVLPLELESKLQRIEDEAFRYCTIGQIVLPQSISSLWRNMMECVDEVVVEDGNECLCLRDGYLTHIAKHSLVMGELTPKDTTLVVMVGEQHPQHCRLQCTSTLL